MFILRRYVGPEKIETNTVLGDSYNIVYRTENPNEFNQCFSTVFGTDEKDSGNICAFVTFADGTRVQALYSGQPSYIMTEKGATFNSIKRTVEIRPDIELV